MSNLPIFVDFPGPGSIKPIPQSNSHFGKIFEVGFQGTVDEVRESQNPQKSTGSTIVAHTAFELKGFWRRGLLATDAMQLGWVRS